MALPPQPLEEVLPDATVVVEATVTELLDSAPAAANRPARPAGHVGGNILEPRQTVRLEIARVLRGALDTTEVTAIKPKAPYLLRAGVAGPFLLQQTTAGDLVILGRYGPDSYSLAAIERALGA